MAHADLIARLAEIAAADRSNAGHVGAGPVADGLRRRAATVEEAIAALDGPIISTPAVAPDAAGPEDAPPARHMDDELGQDDAAASRAAPTRA
jgi:hypothetical protein